MDTCDEKIRNLIKNILHFYIEKEKNNNNKYKFYAHNEFDSNLTDFEALSDERRIILKTKLTDKEDITVIFKTFHGIFGNNLRLFNKKYFPFEIETDEDKEKLFSYEDISIWIKYLKQVIVNNYGIN